MGTRRAVVYYHGLHSGRSGRGFYFADGLVVCMSHKHKNEAELAWLDNRDQVKLDIRKLTRRLENAVMTEVYEQYIDALNQGKILELRPAETELRNIMLQITKKELGR